MSLTAIIFCGVGFVAGAATGVYLCEKQGVKCADLQRAGKTALNQIRQKTDEVGSRLNPKNNYGNSGRCIEV